MRRSGPSQRPLVTTNTAPFELDRESGEWFGEVYARTCQGVPFGGVGVGQSLK
jgi:hypothetical protein